MFLFLKKSRHARKFVKKNIRALKKTSCAARGKIKVRLYKHYSGDLLNLDRNTKWLNVSIEKAAEQEEKNDTNTKKTTEN